MRLKNNLIEKILCERYQKTNKCNCDNQENKLNEEVLEWLYWLKNAPAIPIELAKVLFKGRPGTEVPDLFQEKQAQASTEAVPVSPDFNRASGNVKTAKVKEFSNATGSVISPG
jgi:hypothetical protein